jgi:hypothetical protein
MSAGGRAAEGADVKTVLIAGCMALMCGMAWAGEEEAESTESVPTVTRSWVHDLHVDGLFYLTYQDGVFDDERYSEFFVTRAYLTVEADILPFLSGRLTLDTTQDTEGQGRGDMEVRLKYAFAKFRFSDLGLLNDPNLEAGIVHMVWLDFEEHINYYRMRGPMFMERSGIFNSADFGLTLASGLGDDLPRAFRSYAGNKYGTRNGSFAVGIYNGAGYHGDERNVNKSVEARITWRPLPDLIRGLQVAGLMINGDGNAPDSGDGPPKWRTYNGFLSYQWPRGTFTAQYVSGEGNQRGNWVEVDDPSKAIPYTGFSAFVECKLGLRKQWRLVGAYDRFERIADSGDDFSFVYGHVSVGYDLGKQNILMLDVDQRDWDDPLRETDYRAQVVLQLMF